MTAPTPKAGVNVDLTISLHASESLPAGLDDRDMGFMLATDSKGQPLYSVKDLAPSELIARVQAQGYEINPDTLEITFYKDNWSGPFGLFEERPGSNRCAYAENIDFKGSKPILAPKRYTIGYKVRTATTISFSATTPGTILDSANGLAEFKTGDSIVITGSASNDGTYAISTGAVAGTIRTTEATTAEAAGASVTITVNNGTPPMYDIKDFGSTTYVALNSRFICKVANWGTPGSSYLVSVFKHSDSSAAFVGLHVHNGYLYALAGTSAAYAYSADGSTWTESNRGGTDQQASEMITLRGILHKRVGSNHHQLTAATDTGINGGTAWSSADQIGDTSYAPTKMLVLNDSLVFSSVNGLDNLDGNGNVTGLMPNLLAMAGRAIGPAASAWLNNAIILPMAAGSVKLYQQGDAIGITPMSQIDRALNITQITTPPIYKEILYTAVIEDFVYGFQYSSTNTRIMELEQVGQNFIWRPFLNIISGSYTANQLWGLYVVDSGSAGPVLFGNQTSAPNFLYWILPLGRDATQDSRCRYAASGVIYDPWITMGCPEVPKRWSYIEAAVTESTPANFAKDTYTLDGINEAGTDKIATNSLTLASGITIGNINFDSNTTSRRVRLVHTLGNTGTNQELETPILLWIRVHAFALPTPKYTFSMALDVPTASVGHGLATQDQARRFLAAIRNAQLPMTLTDRFGASWTVNRVVGDPTEGYTKLEGRRTEEVYNLKLIQQPSGV